MRRDPSPPDPSLPDLSGTVVLVTGASGIGSGIALRFAAAGAAVVVHHHSGAERAAAVAAEITAEGGQAATAQADVTASRSLHRRTGRVRPVRGRPAGAPSGKLDPPIYIQHSRSGALAVDGGMAVVPAW